ncbi:unnamed protein product [Adineta ricciae]|uniref:Uncharacterized protein n=1 Tax=Adineta ricciae TaxID=249248 RepID=A0A815Z8C7_ADIRI|nr:unnamed protein product [Adineta ricciae]CAF1581079.1 unnamed protein product [Adineta ricciae]
MNRSNNGNTHADDNKKAKSIGNISSPGSVPYRPSTLAIATTAAANDNNKVYRRFNNLDDIAFTPSPVSILPHIFRPGSIIDAAKFEEIKTDVMNKSVVIPKENKKEEIAVTNYDDMDTKEQEDEGRNLNEILNEARDKEIEHLSQVILTQQFMIDDDDIAAQFILQQLDLVLDTTEEMLPIDNNQMDNNDNSRQDQSSISSNPPSKDVVLKSSSMRTAEQQQQQQQQRPYPPINQTGPVNDHDRPYAEYGHLSRDTIAQELNFNLQATPTAAIPRLHAKSFAITAMTDVSKETVMNYIKAEFGINNIQYICISEELSELNHRRHLHVQIIFKAIIDRRKPFLDDITQTHCNYQVTRSDLAWNEYIKKGDNFIEFNEFKSTKTRGISPRQWPLSSSTESSLRSDDMAASSGGGGGGGGERRRRPVPTITTTTTTTTSVRRQAEEKRQHLIATYEQAVKLARTNVDHAMTFIEKQMIDKFLERGTWYLSMFNYVYLREQREADRRNEIHKDYIWPHSFPDCTPGLYDAVNRWIREEFHRTSRAKCLILIGSTGTGKTSFAMSLPGRVNYFQERWNLDAWNNYARYSVYDDVPWDDFGKLNFPNKKNLLTQKKYEIHATDKYRGAKKLVVRQPAIVLLNPEDAGSLLKEPITDQEKSMAEYWKERAFIYIMGTDEYFYKKGRQTRTATSQGNTQRPSSNQSLTSPSSSQNSILKNDEWEKMYQNYQQQEKKRKQ